MSTKTRNEKYIAILGIPFTADTMSGKHTYKKGYRANVYRMYEYGGEYVVEGHGIGHIIPRANFTKFIHIWDEVTTKEVNGSKVVKTTHHEVDDTDATLRWWASLDEKKNEVKNKARRVSIREDVASLRKMIVKVKTGEAGKEIVRLLEELESLRVDKEKN